MYAYTMAVSWARRNGFIWCPDDFLTEYLDDPWAAALIRPGHQTIYVQVLVAVRGVWEGHGLQIVGVDGAPPSVLSRCVDSMGVPYLDYLNWDKLVAKLAAAAELALVEAYENAHWDDCLKNSKNVLVKEQTPPTNKQTKRVKH